MNKIFSVLLISVLLICTICMTSCELLPGSGTPEPGEHVHEFVDTVIKNTCADEGYTVHKCECGYVMHDTFVPADGESHKYEVVSIVDPTCTVDGQKTSVCQYCGDTVIETIKASHNFGKWVEAVSATCTTFGEERRYCSDCTYYESREIAPAHVINKILDVIVEPTCTTDGYTIHKCEHCDYTYKDTVVKAIGHKWIPNLDTVNGDEWVTILEGDCTHRGEEMRQCEVCELIEKRYTNTLPHNYELTVTEPTCTTCGYTTYVCTDCGNTVVDDYVDPCHTFGNWEVYVAPTCKQSGLERRYCEVEGCEHFEERKMEPQHYYDTVRVVEPTKFTSGYTDHLCECGLSYRDNYISAIGSEGLEYELRRYWNEDTLSYDVYYVVVGLGTCTDVEIAIPFEHNNIPVKELDYQLFKGNSDITKVYLTRNITKIGVSAFWNCENLTEIHYDGTVAEWEAIDKGETWNAGLKTHKVICSDRTLTFYVLEKEEEGEVPEEK